MNSTLSTAVRALVSRFRRQRPLRAGSLLLTVLGDAIAPRGGAITLGSLIRLAQPFGIGERLVRTSVARLAQEDWLVGSRAGRRSEYRLSARGAVRFREATRRIYGASPSSWDGRWTLVLLPFAATGPRQRLREELRWLGFGQLIPGLLAHPTRSAAEVRRRLAELGLKLTVTAIGAVEIGLGDSRVLVEDGWHLQELDRRYRRFSASFSGVRKALAGAAEPAPEAAFLIRTLLIHEYRRLHLRDPLLPQVLLPARFGGTAAHELCRDLYRSVFVAAERHIGAHGETLNGKLPALSRATWQRFGGIRVVNPAPASER